MSADKNSIPEEIKGIAKIILQKTVRNHLTDYLLVFYQSRLSVNNL